MNTQTKIHSFFNRFKSDTDESLFLPNEYTPPKGVEGVRIEKTVEAEKGTFNEVFENTIK